MSLHTGPSDVIKKKSANFFYFDIYGVKVQVLTENPHTAQTALNSFQYFQADTLPELDIVIELHSRKQQPSKLHYLPVFKFRGAKVFGLRERLIHYTDEATVLLKKSQRLQRATLYCDSASLKNELLFLLISSLAGWELEKRGWLRLHAVSWLNGDVARALLGDSGVGKSSFALRCLQNKKLLFSDEITLLSPNLKIYPWPIPLQLGQDLIDKFGLDNSNLIEFSKRLYATKWQLPLKRSEIAAATSLSDLVTPHSWLGVVQRVTLGTGLPQILEFQLRLDNLTSMVLIMSRRLRFILKLLVFRRLHCHVSRERWESI